MPSEPTCLASILWWARDVSDHDDWQLTSFFLLSPPFSAQTCLTCLPRGSGPSPGSFPDPRQITCGTRLINQGVPQHVIQRLLGHASPQMTARYASLHDTTVRRAFDEYCQQRVNLDGERIAYDPAGVTADAEWTKHNMARVQASLPNGYCGRPPQQDRPHLNACLTCPDFQTTPEFLDIHRRQRDETRTLIATAEADGRFRLAANHRQVHNNLDQLIDALETIGDNTP